MKSLFGVNSSYSISMWPPNKDSSHRIRILCISPSAETRLAYFRTTPQKTCLSSKPCCARKPNTEGLVKHKNRHCNSLRRLRAAVQSKRPCGEREGGGAEVVFGLSYQQSHEILIRCTFLLFHQYVATE